LFGSSCVASAFLRRTEHMLRDEYKKKQRNYIHKKHGLLMKYLSTYVYETFFNVVNFETEVINKRVAHLIFPKYKYKILLLDAAT
jgi:hypothetical protein